MGLIKGVRKGNLHSFTAGTNNKFQIRREREKKNIHRFI